MQFYCRLITLIVLLFVYPVSLFAHVQRFVPVIVAKLPHDSKSFTQGLAIEEDQLYESTGLYGQSTLQHLDISTGQLLQKHTLTSQVFAEGLAAFPQNLFQLTWKEHKAFIYERPSLKLLNVLSYSGEGWGLCRDENSVWMSNGTATLTQRDRHTFAIIKTLSVKWDNLPVPRLNDLECDGKYLYANVWKKDLILRINKLTGDVTGVIDASKLLSEYEKSLLNPEEVLNGIAYRTRTKTFFLTGKGWPWIFEVYFVPQ